jgi:cytoskeletal protein CcmA (bactofilin family)
MFGRRNPDQSPNSTPPSSQGPSESDIDLDLLPDLPTIPPPTRHEPEPEAPPSDPAWHAGATPFNAPQTRLPDAPVAPPASPATIPLPPPAEPAQPAFVRPPAPPEIAQQPVIPPSAPTELAFQPVIAPASAVDITTASGQEKAPRPKSTSESVIGPDDFFDGRYRSERGVRIQGNARGSIESRQYIFVEGGAEVEADLSAEDITVAGSFNGKIECRRRLEITSTGKVQGQVQTTLLVVHEGGVIDGELHMRGSEPPANP